MEMFTLLLWAICFIGCCYLASEKRRSVGFWGICGFLFGIFALIVLALLPALPKVLVIPTKED